MNGESSFDAELFFAALADKTRLRLLNLMRDGEVCVCFFASALGTNNPKISRHLSYLKRANLVTGRREGKWMHYRLNEPSEPDARKVFDAAMKLIEGDSQMKADKQRLIDYCCSIDRPIEISRSREQITA